MATFTPLTDQIAIQFRRILYAFYYEFVFDRRFPFSTRVATAVASLETVLKREDVPRPKAVWESEYQHGGWTFLEHLDEVPRYSVIIGYLTALKPCGAVLDVGCGEGLLFRRYRPYQHARYVGVDVCASAIDKLKTGQVELEASGLHEFVCATAESYVPHERFDAIVFNESLYYFRDSLAVVDRYVGALKARGIVIVSTYQNSRRARSILRSLKSRYPLVDETQLRHSYKRWVCSVFAPDLDAVRAS